MPSGSRSSRPMKRPGSELNKPFVRTLNSPGRHSRVPVLSGRRPDPHRGTVRRDGRAGFAEPPQDFRSAVRRARGTRKRARARSSRRSPGGRFAVLCGLPGSRHADGVLPGGAERGGGTFDAGIEARAAAHSRRPGIHLSRRARVGQPGRRANPIASATSSWRRVCRSSCGAASRRRTADRGRAGQAPRIPRVLEQQVQRMIADPKSQALVENFTGQWLNVRGMAGEGAGDEHVPGLRRARCGRRSVARSSCSSTASSARTAACSIC